MSFDPTSGARWARRPEACGPAGRLEGYCLNGGWQVGKRVDRPLGGGDDLTEHYPVRDRDGTEGLLQATDFSLAFAGVRFSSDVLEQLISAYNAERDLVRQCADARMSRVVRALADGSVPVPGADLPVMYIIFEMAAGDIRERMTTSRRFDRAWKLRSLHDVAVGLSQLHRGGIVHETCGPRAS